MIDVHCHILPQIDDGSQSVDNSFELMKEAYNNGFTDIITTSHFIKDGDYNASINYREKLIDAFQSLLDENNIKLKLYNGAEAYITPDLPRLYSDELIPTLAGSKYVLFELPMSQNAIYTENVINELEALGYFPIIAHPERYDFVKNNIEIARKWKQMGAYLQCNYGSLVGKYGTHAKKTIFKLLKEDLVSFLGTDTHVANTNYSDIDKMMKILIKEVGIKKAKELTDENPSKIIRNEIV